jgi:hypothetical protein
MDLWTDKAGLTHLHAILTSLVMEPNLQAYMVHVEEGGIEDHV